MMGEFLGAAKLTGLTGLSVFTGCGFSVIRNSAYNKLIAFTDNRCIRVVGFFVTEIHFQTQIC